MVAHCQRFVSAKGRARGYLPGTSWPASHLVFCLAINWMIFIHQIFTFRKWLVQSPFPSMKKTGGFWASRNRTLRCFTRRTKFSTVFKKKRWTRPLNQCHPRGGFCSPKNQKSSADLTPLFGKLNKKPSAKKNSASIRMENHQVFHHALNHLRNGKKMEKQLLTSISQNR